VPEPAASPSNVDTPPGQIVSLPGQPEGLALDSVTGLVAVAVRNPDAVVLVDLVTGEETARAALGGRQPHDAAPAAGGVVFVGDELADTVHIVAPDGSSDVVVGPVQPGGVAASADGSVVVVIGVRGRQIQAFAPDGRSLGTAACGVGPTHVRAGAGGLFYVADTQGGAILVFEADSDGIRQVGKVSTEGGAPYGLAVDTTHRRLYVTLTGTNQLRSYRIDGERLTPERTWDTVAQPNDVAVDERTGRVVVAGTSAGLLQLLDP